MKSWFSRQSHWGIVAVLAAVALPCLASEVAVLKNGFSIRHERREVVGDVTRLYVNADGSSYVDIPTAQIEHFEAAPELPVSEIAPFVKNAKGGAAASHAASGGTSYSPVAAGNGRPVRDLSQVVNEASGRYRLDPDLVNSVIKAESGFNVRAVSPKGAQGLMQLMPGTASQLGVPNAFDARANVDGGARYLRELLERYNFDMVKALAAYNAGPQRVEQFGGVPPYHETRAYVARIVRDFNKKKVAQEKAAAAQAKVPAKSASKTQTSATKPHGSSAVAQAGSNASQVRQ
jgi:soluble lytic murein transglycosylase-like protein